jgi:hypothetical protein
MYVACLYYLEENHQLEDVPNLMEIWNTMFFLGGGGPKFLIWNTFLKVLPSSI